MSETLDVKVEQAIAAGRSVEWITTHLPVTAVDVEAVRLRLDAVVADDPWVQQQRMAGAA